MTLSIERRFSGPPDCANGGYAAGVFARALPDDVAVRLHQPVPLETELQLANPDPARWELRCHEACIASARATSFTPEVPDLALSYRDAASISDGYRKLSNLRFNGCFVCGIARAPSDGLCIFPGAVPNTNMVAAPWRPDPSVGTADGRVHDEIVWAALDCPGYFAAFSDRRYALLGELAVRIERPLSVGEEYVVVAWPGSVEGRKRRAGSALYDREQRRVAFAAAIWIEVNR